MVIGLMAVGLAVATRYATLAVLNSPGAAADITGAPQIDPPPTGTDIGEVWESLSSSATITIHNPTAASLVIPSFSTSCSCAGTNPTSLTLPASGLAPVEVILNTTQRTWAEIGQSRRKLAVRVQPLASGIDLPPVELYGVVKSRVTLDKLELHFGDSVIAGQSPVTRTVAALRHVHGAEMTARIEPPIAAVTIEHTAAQSAKLHVTPNVALKPGSHAAKLIVEVVEGKVTSYGASIPVTFELLPARRLFPHLLTLAPKPSGTAVETRLEPPSGVTVESASASDDGWTVAVAGNTVTVSTTVPKSGVRTGEITITTRAGGGVPSAIKVMKGERIRVTLPTPDKETLDQVKYVVVGSKAVPTDK